MLTYSKAFHGLPLLFRGFLSGGSTVSRVLLFPLLSTVETIVLFHYLCTGSASFAKSFVSLVIGTRDENGAVIQPKSCNDGRWFLSPMPYSIFTSFLGFVIVFRCNHSLTRYWEARSAMQLASNRWAEACMQLILLDEGISGEAVSDASLAFRQRLIHLFSLLNAVASNYLRDGLDLRRHYRRYSNPMLRKVKPAAEPKAGADAQSWFPDVLNVRGYGGGQNNVVLITQNLQAHEHTFRRSHPLHNFFSYTWGPQANRLCCEALPMPVIGGISESEISALEVTPERVRLVVCWIHRAVMARSSSELGFLVPKRPSDGSFPSPMSHMGRCLSLLGDGMNAWSQARKVADTPFPFPHAHLVAIALVIFAFSCPIVMVSWSGSLWTAVLMNALAVSSFWSLNEVSVDMEDPFIGPPNNICLARLQAAFHEEISCYAAQYIIPMAGDVQASEKSVHPASPSRLSQVAADVTTNGEKKDEKPTSEEPPVLQPNELDSQSAIAASFSRTAAGAGSDMHAVLSGSVYSQIYRHMLPIVAKAGSEEESGGTVEEMEPPESPRQAYTRFYA